MLNEIYVTLTTNVSAINNKYVLCNTKKLYEIIINFFIKFAD